MRGGYRVVSVGKRKRVSLGRSTKVLRVYHVLNLCFVTSKGSTALIFFMLSETAAFFTIFLPYSFSLFLLLLFSSLQLAARTAAHAMDSARWRMENIAAIVSRVGLVAIVRLR